MFKRIFTIMILAVFLSAASHLQPVAAQTGGQDSQLIQKTRLKVREIGSGERSRVEVKLQNGAQLKGHIRSASDDSFTVVDQSTGAERTINYSEVKQVKKAGGISKLKWGIIAGAAAAAVIVGATVLYPVLCDGGAGC